MGLMFRSGIDKARISKTDITIGYRDGWDLSRFGGNYTSGKNFFSVHWEISNDSPNIVKFHVESPRAGEKDDEKINNIKCKLIADIKENINEIILTLKNGNFKDSSRTNNLKNIKNNKSSEVFQIILDETTNYNKAKESIKLVDDDLSKNIDIYIKKYSDELKKLNLIETKKNI